MNYTRGSRGTGRPRIHGTVPSVRPCHSQEMDLDITPSDFGYMVGYLPPRALNIEGSQE